MLLGAFCRRIKYRITALFQHPWLPVNCCEWDCRLTESIKTNCLSHRRDKINQVFSQIKILQMEQALGSTDPPDKSERNSRQMCFGDKEDPMEKKMQCCLWSKNRLKTERVLWYIIFYRSWHIYRTFFTKLFVLSVFIANIFYRLLYFYFIYRYF